MSRVPVALLRSRGVSSLLATKQTYLKRICLPFSPNNACSLMISIFKISVCTRSTAEMTMKLRPSSASARPVFRFCRSPMLLFSIPLCCWGNNPSLLCLYVIRYSPPKKSTASITCDLSFLRARRAEKPAEIEKRLAGHLVTFLDRSPLPENFAPEASPAFFKWTAAFFPVLVRLLLPCAAPRLFARSVTRPGHLFDIRIVTASLHT